MGPTLDAGQKRLNLWEALFEIVWVFFLLTGFKGGEEPRLRNDDGIEILPHKCRGASAESERPQKLLHGVELGRLQRVYLGGPQKGFRHGVHGREGGKPQQGLMICFVKGLEVRPRPGDGRLLVRDGPRIPLGPRPVFTEELQRCEAKDAIQ